MRTPKVRRTPGTASLAAMRAIGKSPRAVQTALAKLDGYACVANWDCPPSPDQNSAAFQTFEASWQVPAAPTSAKDQTLFLFIGVQPPADSPGAKAIIQPVLQWGNTDAGGGAYWSVSSWFVQGSQGKLDVASYTKPVPVQPGDKLVARITQGAGYTGTYQYTSEFVGIDGTALFVETPLNFLQFGIAFEAYHVTAAAELPGSAETTFSNFSIEVGNQQQQGLVWSPTTFPNDFAIQISSPAVAAGIPDVIIKYGA